MNARTKGLLATAAAVVLCGCPGLFACIFGALGATGTPIDTDLNGVSSSAPMPMSFAIGLLCLALILFLIPVVVGFFTLRSKPAAAPVTPVTTEPLPPAS